MRRRSFLNLGGSTTAMFALGGPLLRSPRDLLLDGTAICRTRDDSPIIKASFQIAQTALPGANIAKFVDPLPIFAGKRISAAAITVGMSEFQQQVLPASIYANLVAPFDKGTFVWGYQVDGAPPSYPGYSIEAQRGTATTVTYNNNLPPSPVLQKYLTVDQTIHWADPLKQMGSMSPYAGPPPLVPHLHGGEVHSASDGNTEAWFTPGATLRGPGYSTNVYTYPNQQEAATLWFHDHTLGITRLNVYAGLAAFYLIRDQFDTGVEGTGLKLPAGPYEIETVIQDRRFDTNGQWLYPDNGHPFWKDEFFGDTMVVNGKSWPYLRVEPRRYRFRLVNGCSSRFLELRLNNADGIQAGPAFWQIGTDGGLLDRPVQLNNLQSTTAGQLVMAPAERADIIVDFSGFAGQTLILRNTGRTPYPTGSVPNAQTVGQVMQIRVDLPLSGSDTSYNPAVAGATLRGGAGQPPAIVRLADPVRGVVASGVTITQRRQLTLVEANEEFLLNNTEWSGRDETTRQPIPGFKVDPLGNYVSEWPQVGSTELWEIANFTGHTHPIHLHLVQFQIVGRQTISGGVSARGGSGPPGPYNTPNADGALGGNPAFSTLVRGQPRPPEPNEAGWKDTIIVLPHEVTRIVVRWAPQDVAVADVSPGVNRYPFDPTTGPGYVWHCHLLEHEDNEMMRPYLLTS